MFLLASRRVTSWPTILRDDGTWVFVCFGHGYAGPHVWRLPASFELAALVIQAHAAGAPYLARHLVARTEESKR